MKKINYKDSTTIPPFCRINHPDPRYKNTDWKKKFGEDFIYINHYCGKKAIWPLCYQYPEKEKNACLTFLLEGTTYAFEHTSNPNYPLLPFLYTEHGTILKEIGRYGEAIQSFNTAIQKNKKYIRAYVMLADTYILTKQYDEAEKVVNEGLKYKKSKALYKKLEKIKASKK
jgi:tetratricopeptide (TPR) repeat protein